MNIFRTFAFEYERDEKGRVLFPRDTLLRRRFFPFTNPSEHIAKANMLMVRELARYVSEPGETILDPFGGTGTLMIGAVDGRKIILIELEDTFCQTIELNLIGVKQTVDYVEDLVTVIPGDSISILPIPEFVNHLIFSPPYPMGFKKKGEMDSTSKDVSMGASAEYSQDERNLTNLNDFMYHQKMEVFYRKCLQTLKPGGTMTVIIKDRMVHGVRVLQADRTERDCIRAGFELVARNKWYAPGGGYAEINRSAGLETVDEEDLITLRKRG